MRIKRWIAVLLTIGLLVAAAACGSSKSPEQQYAQAIQQSLDSGDTEQAKKILKEALNNFPDSTVLQALKEKVNGEQTAPEASGNAQEAAVQTSAAAKNTEPPTAEQMQTIFRELSALYRTWFTSMDLEYDGSSAKSVHTATGDATGGTQYAYRVQNASVRTKADLDALFLPYCTQEVYEHFADPMESWAYDLQPCRYLDLDGELFVVAPDLVFSATDEDVQIEQQNDGSFLVRFIRVVFVRENTPRGGNEEYFRCTMRYNATDDGYRFDSFSAASMMIGDKIGTGTFIVNTSGSDLMLHSAPSDSEQSRIGSVKNGTIVTVQQSLVDWAYIETESDDYGWVSTQYLAPYSSGQYAVGSTPANHNNTNNVNNGNAIDQIINGGLQIADGIIRAIQ